MSCAWAFGSPPLCGGHAVGGGVPVAPVGAAVGLGEGDTDGLGEGRATLGLGVGAAVTGALVGGVGDGVAVGAQAPAMSRMRRISWPRTFVV